MHNRTDLIMTKQTETLIDNPISHRRLKFLNISLAYCKREDCSSDVLPPDVVQLPKNVNLFTSPIPGLPILPFKGWWIAYKFPEYSFLTITLFAYLLSDSFPSEQISRSPFSHEDTSISIIISMTKLWRKGERDQSRRITLLLIIWEQFYLSSCSLLIESIKAGQGTIIRLCKTIKSW